jgi:hypothetical protein
VCISLTAGKEVLIQWRMSLRSLHCVSDKNTKSTDQQGYGIKGKEK